MVIRATKRKQSDFSASDLPEFSPSEIKAFKTRAKKTLKETPPARRAADEAPRSTRSVKRSATPEPVKVRTRAAKAEEKPAKASKPVVLEKATRKPGRPPKVAVVEEPIRRPRGRPPANKDVPVRAARAPAKVAAKTPAAKVVAKAVARVAPVAAKRGPAKRG